jgi:uncharacterized NAD(P)/FAD-binding protein YdhS
MRIAIIGGGATGVLAALHLARVLSRDVAEILIIEPATTLGRGLAYSTEDPRHLLNVRVANMSAFADQPEHLFQWLQERGSLGRVKSATPFCFIPRGVYGDYIGDLAQGLLTSGVIRHIRARCINLIETEASVTLKLDLRENLVCDCAILAMGNDPKPALSGVPALQPWTKETLSDLEANAPILIVGTGLTMVDMVLSLDRNGHRARITALSHHGLIPSAHRPTQIVALASTEVPFGSELSQLTGWLRRFARAIASGGGDWRSAIDALRPHTQRLWRSMSAVQKRRFLRHARPYWDVHRHRMAPEVEEQISALRTSGRLDIVAGRIVRAERTGHRVTVKIARRGGLHVEAAEYGRLIDCTGLADDPLRSSNPLMRALLMEGNARTDALGIGLDIDEEYALVNVSSESSKRVRAIGPLARAAFWECIAIPDIRLQCRDLAQKIAANTSAPARAGSAPVPRIDSN